ncbi:MAG: inositol monophosphatase family protein [Acidimicrobiia bacterium]
MTPDTLLTLFGDAAAAAGVAIGTLTGPARRHRTEQPGQYALDLVADRAVLDVLHRADVGVVSEESGRSGHAGAEVTVVVDPVDGSTNCARDLPYWGVSLCALDHDGPLCALVANQATGTQTVAIREGGAWRDGTRVEASRVRDVSKAVVAVSGMPRERVGWAQFRALGSTALALCDVAAGNLDGYLDGGVWDAPWDYLGGILACTEAGAVVVDGADRPLSVADPEARRQVLAAATPDLLNSLLPAVVA